MAFGHWKQKIRRAVDPRTLQQIEKMIKIFQKTGLTAYFIGCRPEVSEYRAAGINTTMVQKVA